MAVPNRPNAGGVVESAWGQVVHDAAVAVDVQSGRVTPGNASPGQPVSAQVAVTFARPFASPPIVLVSSDNFNYFAGLNGAAPTATGFVCAVFRPAGGNGLGSPISWVAIGPRA